MLCDSANKVAHTAHSNQTNIQVRKEKERKAVTLNGKRCNKMNRGGRKEERETQGEECGVQTIRKEIE